MASFKNLISTTSAQISSGGTITGDLVINGDLQVDGGGSLSFDEIIQGTQVIDVTNTEALLVRKNDDGGDVFVVDTTNSGVGINTSAGGWGLNIKGSDANVFKVQASDGNTLSFLQGTNGDATQKWFADGNVTKVLINTNGDSYFTGGSLGIGTASPTMSLEISNTSFGDQLRLHRSSVASGGFLTLSANDSAGNIHDYAKLGTVVESSTNGSEDGALVFQTSLDGTLTEYLRVTSAGNVGIGTDSPRKIFHSYSSTGVNIVGLFESSDNQALIAFRDNTTGDDNHVMIGANGTSFAISTDNTERMVIDSSGNVTVNSGSAIQFGDSSYKIIGSTAGNYLRFYTESTQALEINDSQNATFAGDITVSKSGNAFLNLTSTGGGARIKLTGQANETTNGLLFYEVGNQRGQINYNHSDQKMEFKTGDSTTLALTLDSSQNATFAGNVTVNGDTLSLVKSNNNAFLKIESTDGGEAIFEMRATTNRTNQIRFFEGATQRGSIVYAHASQSLTFNTGDSATAKLVLDDNSRISLGNNDSGGGTTNTIFGRLAGNQMASGAAHNTAIGSSALDGMLTGTHNTAIGSDAMGSADGGEAENTAVGYRAMFNNNNGLGNTCIGAGTNLSAVNGQGQIAIGKDVSCIANETATLGFGSNVASLGLDGSDTSWAASSDERLKENIADSTAGLDVINDLRPVTYNWKKAKDIDKSMPQYKDSDEPVLGKEYGESLHGFIAQEVKVVIDKHDSLKEGFKMWKQSNDGTQTIADGNLIPILVKAVQELSARVKELENN